jgi:hypothetical protein
MAVDDCKPSEMLIYIDLDGAAYELTADDKLYVDTEFAPGDSGAPSVKCDYGSRNGWGLLDGFLMRSKLPAGMPIHPASERPPSSQRARTARLRALAADATTPETKARLLELVRASERIEAFTDGVAPPEADQAPVGMLPAGGGSR